jgi:hypothetical protein
MHCGYAARPGTVEHMTQRWSGSKLVLMGMLEVLMALTCGISRAEQPSPAAVAEFNTYVGALDARLAAQHRQNAGFVVLEDPAAQTEARLRRGEFVVENLTPAKTDLPGATLYHWRGTAFLPGGRAVDFEQLMRGFAAYPRIYAPQVVSAKVLSQNGDRYQATMRVKQKHVITVVMDTTYNIEFGRVDARHGWSNSRSIRIDEIDNAGTKNERERSPADQHGFLWCLNTYWTFEERDGGLYVQVESVSLTRSIPSGLGWVIGPFVGSVPRESLEFTLRATSYALRR